MDLHSFCVENKKKNNPFSFLRSTGQTSGKNSNSFEYGVPVNVPNMEENYLKNISNMSCDVHFCYPTLDKPECHTKKNSFDHFNKFSQFSFSRVVGGFVGSKSQVGSASREQHRVWDVILRQMVNSACQATMNNNAFSFGETVSESIFAQFSDQKNSTIDFTSFILANSCDFLSEETNSRNMPSPKEKIFCGEAKDDYVQIIPDSSQSDNSQLCNNRSSHDPVKSNIQECKSRQSYAEVARTTKPECHIKSVKYNHLNGTLPLRNTSLNSQYSKRDYDELQRKPCTSGNAQSSFRHSSHKQLKKKTILTGDKNEEYLTSKTAGQKFERSHRSKAETLGLHKIRSKEVNTPVLNVASNLQERPQRFNKFRNYNMRDKERKNIDFQVHEDIVYACGLPPEMCQNWRCNHNRLSNKCKGRIDSKSPVRCGTSRNLKPQSRFHSPPSRVLDCVEISKKTGRQNSNSCVRNNAYVGVMSEERLCNNIKSDLCGTLDLSNGGDSSESSFSSSPKSAVVLPSRPRVTSECSIESEDSSIVFEKDGSNGDEVESDLEDDNSFSSSDLFSDSDENDDEVDFCYVIPSDDVNCKIDEASLASGVSSASSKLKNINDKWHEENKVVPGNTKAPKKVHFPVPEKLTQVHHMFHWPFAYRAARRGPWEEIGRDRCRFRMRIEQAEKNLSPVLNPMHRRRIWEERTKAMNSL